MMISSCRAAKVGKELTEVERMLRLEYGMMAQTESETVAEDEKRRASSWKS